MNFKLRGGQILGVEGGKRVMNCAGAIDWHLKLENSFNLSHKQKTIVRAFNFQKIELCPMPENSHAASSSLHPISLLSDILRHTRAIQ